MRLHLQLEMWVWKETEVSSGGRLPSVMLLLLTPHIPLTINRGAVASSQPPSQRGDREKSDRLATNQRHRHAGWLHRTSKESNNADRAHALQQAVVLAQSLGQG